MNALIMWLRSQPWLWASVGVVLGPILFVRGFLVLRRQRLIADTPRSTVRAAALGQVEVSGKAAGPYTLVAPLSQADCLYYRVTVKSSAQGALSSKGVRELCAPFFLDDGTGTVLIYPDGCELQMQPSWDTSERGSLAPTVAGVEGGERELAQEYCIKPGDEIFVLGKLQENPWAKKNPMTESSELSRIGPGFVSAGEADLLRREAYPLLDPTLPAGAEIASPADFDLHPPVILMKGSGPLVISRNSQREVVSKLRWKSLLYIWGGAVIALWSAWMILNQAKAAGLLPPNF